LRKVKIGANVVVGLNSVIMPGVEIGDGAIVAAGVIVPKDTIILPRTVYVGPAQEREQKTQSLGGSGAKTTRNVL
jgi:acetyltransferase-like isoleucine patch superfamily enzyme